MRRKGGWFPARSLDQLPLGAAAQCTSSLRLRRWRWTIVIGPSWVSATEQKSAVRLAAVQHAVDQQALRLALTSGLKPEAHAPISDAQSPRGWLTGSEMPDVTVLGCRIALDGRDNPVSGLAIEAAQIAQGAGRPD